MLDTSVQTIKDYLEGNDSNKVYIKNLTNFSVFHKVKGAINKFKESYDNIYIMAKNGSAEISVQKKKGFQKRESA